MSEKFFKVKSGITTANITFNNKTVNSNLQVSFLQSNVLSFSGTSGQLFSIADTMTGTIFAVNDISGVPSIEVYDTGDIRLAETFGNVLVGSATNPSNVKFYINGSVGITGAINANGSVGTAGQVLTSNVTGVYWSTLANTNAVQANLNTVSSNVNTVTTNLGTVSSNLNALTTSVTTISGNVNTLTTNLGTVSSNVNNILSGTTTFSGSKTFTGNVVLNAISASNSYGSPGQVLTSNSSGVYWSTVTASSGLGASSYVVRAVKNGSTQTVPANTDTLVTMVDDFDPQGWWTPNKFQPTIAGYYSISTQLWWNAGSINNNQTNLQLRKNGSVQLAIAQTPVNNSTVGEFLSISTIAYFNGTTDYVEVTAYSSNPTSQDINGAGSGTWFVAALLASGWNESSINNVQSNVATVSSNLNALTTSVGTISSNVNSVTTNLGTVSSNLNTLTTSVSTISSNVNSITTNLGTVSSNLNALTTSTNTILANVNSVQSNLATVSTNVNSIASNVSTLTTDLGTVSSNLNTLTTSIGIISSNVNSVTTNLGTVSTNVNSIAANVTNILTGTTAFTGNINLTAGINANSSVGTAGQVLTSNGSVAYWSTPSSGGITTGKAIAMAIVFGG